MESTYHIKLTHDEWNAVRNAITYALTKADNPTYVNQLKQIQQKLNTPGPLQGEYKVI